MTHQESREAFLVPVVIHGESKVWGEEATEVWISGRIARIQRDGIRVCVKVSIETSGVKIALSTQACGGFGGGGIASFSKTEEKVIALWKKLGLDQTDLAAGYLIAFLKQLTNAAAA